MSQQMEWKFTKHLNRGLIHTDALDPALLNYLTPDKDGYVEFSEIAEALSYKPYKKTRDKVFDFLLNLRLKKKEVIEEEPYKRPFRRPSEDRRYDDYE